MNIPHVVKELVKNAIDAKSTFVEVEINGNFDLRVIDDGCGFDEAIVETIGRRQVFVSNAFKEFRYGKNGKFLLTVAQDIENIYIESIQRNSNIRFYKSINYQSESKIFRTSREQKDAIVLTEQGTSVVMDNFIFYDVSDPNSLKRDINDAVMELALINFDINFSIKDTATQTMLFETERMDTLFGKFEHFLKSNRVFSKLHFASYQKPNVKLDLLICENCISSSSLQFVYLNKLIESDGKLMKYINHLLEKEFKNDSNGKFPVYLVDIRFKSHFDEKLENNLIMQCIKKCIEQLLKPSSKHRTTKEATLQKRNYQDNLEFLNGDDPGVKHQSNCNECKMQGVPLGDWIFNNSYEDYEMVVQSKKMYRNKICENWVISLEKPKPKDPNDSLAFVDLERNQDIFDSDVVKKPLKRNACKPYVRKDKVTKTVRSNHILKSYGTSRIIPEIVTTAASKHFVTPLLPPWYIPEPVTASNHVLQPFRPPPYIPEPVTAAASNHVMTPFKPSQYVEDLNISTLERARQLLEKHENDLQSNLLNNMHATDASHNPPDNNQNCLNTRVPTSQLLDFPFINDIGSRNHFQICESVKETFDFEFHNNLYKSNVNMSFASAIVSSDIHYVDDKNDDFMKFLEKEVSEMKLHCDFLENLELRNTPQSINPPNHFASAIHATSQVQYHRQRENNSPSTRYRSEISSRMTKTRQSKSIRSSSNSRTTVVSRRNPSTATNDDIYQSGRPVTININFGESK